MDYKYKFLEEADVTRLNELCQNGEGELLAKFGFECVHAYQMGAHTGTKVVVGVLTGVLAVSSYALYRISKGKKSKESE